MSTTNKGASVSHDRALLATNVTRTVDPVPSARKLDVPIVPASVSQRTCLAVTGLTSAKFLEIVPAWRIPSTRVGQLLVVETTVLLRALREHATEIATPLEELSPTAAEDRIVQQLGLRRTV